MVRGREQTVVDLLVGQHEDVREQFEKVAKATGKNRAAAFDRLRYLLAVHETAEGRSCTRSRVRRSATARGSSGHG